VTVTLRAAHADTEFPPCNLEFEGIYLEITSSDGQRLFTASLGQDRELVWNLITIGGQDYWQAVYQAGQQELMYRNVAADISLTVLMKNNSGATLDVVEISIMGATYPIT